MKKALWALKFISLFILSVTILVNLIIFLIFNHSGTQRLLAKIVNEGYLHDKNIDIEIGGASLYFIPASASVTNLVIYEYDKKQKRTNELLRIEKIFARIDVISSYFHHMPVINGIEVKGVKSHLRYLGNQLQIPLIIQELINSPTDPENDILDKLQKTWSFIPDSIFLKELQVSFGAPSETNFQLVNLDHLYVEKKNENKQDFLEGKLKLRDIKINSPFLKIPFFSDGSSFKMIFSKSGEFEIKEALFRSTHLSIESLTGKLNLGKQFLQSRYSAKVKFEIDAKNMLSLAGLDGKGKVNASLSITSSSSSLTSPNAKGMVDWRDVKILQFDVYSGNASVFFKDLMLTYTKAEIRTPNSAVLQASGSYEFRNTFPFKNTARVINLSLAELLKGLGVNEPPVDLLLNSESIQVNGHILSANKNKKFELFALGTVTSKEISALVYDKGKLKKRISIYSHPFDGLVTLAASALELNFMGTKLNFTGDHKKGEVTLSQGVVQFMKSPIANFKIKGNGVPLHGLETLLGAGNEGIVDLTADLRVEPGKPLSVAGGIMASQFQLIGNPISATNFKYKWEYPFVTLSEFSADILNKDGEKEEIKVNAAEVALNPFDWKLKVNDLNVLGQLSLIDPFFKNILKMRSVSGEVKKLNLNFSGSLKDIHSWDINLQMAVSQMVFNSVWIYTLNAKVNCAKGKCTDSRLLAFNPKESNQEASYLYDAIKYPHFIINLALISLVKDNVEILLNIEDFDLSFLNGFIDKTLLAGQIDMGHFYFVQKNGLLNMKFYTVCKDVKAGGFHLGDIKIEGNSKDETNHQIMLNAFSDSLQFSLNIPKNLKDKSHYVFNFKDFDATQILSPQTVSRFNLYSNINGIFSLKGLLPLHNSHHGESWLKSFDGEGLLNLETFQLGKVIFSSMKPIGLKIKNSIFEMEKLEIKNEYFKFNLQSKIDFNKTYISAYLGAFGDLSKIEDLSNEIFGPSVGKSDGYISVDGKWDNPQITAKFNLIAEKLMLKEAPPMLEDVQANLAFYDNTLHIQTLKAKKGLGSIAAYGSIDYRNAFAKKTEGPEVKIKIMTDHSQFRIKAPIFKQAELVLTSDLQIKGNSKPYLLAGNIVIDKLRMYRDYDCKQLIKEIQTRVTSDNFQKKEPLLKLDLTVNAYSSLSIQSRCFSMKASTSPFIKVGGDVNDVFLKGIISVDQGAINLPQSKLMVKKALFDFNEKRGLASNVDISLKSRIVNYSIYLNLSGPSDRLKIETDVNPTTLANGDRITQADIFEMISSGTIPSESSPIHLFTAGVSAASLTGLAGAFDENMTSAVSTVTGGVIQRVGVQPTSQNGQFGFKVTATRTITDKINLGLNYEVNQQNTTPSVDMSVFVNDTISLLLRGANSSSAATHDKRLNLSGSLRFKFGGN